MLENHVGLTNSTKARKILAEFDREFTNFKVAIPKGIDYHVAGDAASKNWIIVGAQKSANDTYHNKIRPTLEMKEKADPAIDGSKVKIASHTAKSLSHKDSLVTEVVGRRSSELKGASGMVERKSLELISRSKSYHETIEGEKSPANDRAIITEQPTNTLTGVRAAPSQEREKGGNCFGLC